MHSLLRPLVDTTDEGIVLEKGDVLVGMELPNGEKIQMKSHLSVDGKTAWDEAIKGNAYSFGGVYKANGTADPAKIEQSYLVDHAAATKAMGL
jgi:hypothetical protein